MLKQQEEKWYFQLFHHYVNNRPMRIAVFFVLLMQWLSALYPTDSYFSIYIIYALLGAMTFVWNLKTGYGYRQMRLGQITGIVIFSSVFALSVMMANYDILKNDTPMFAVVLMPLCGFLIASNIFCFILNQSEHRVPRCVETKRDNALRVFIIAFFCISFVDFLYLFLCYYPGNLSYDSVYQIKQIVTNEYTNHHPYWHTMLIKICLKAGLWLFNSINAGVAVYSVFQIACMASIFAFLIMTLYQAGVSKGLLLISTAVYALIPYHILYSMTMWKDILFGGTVALFGGALYRIIRGIGKSSVNCFALILGATGFGLLRSNGWAALFVTTVLSAFILGKTYRKVLFMMVAVLVFTFILKHPVMKWLNVDQPDTVEHLSIPIQQIAQVIVNDAPLTSEEREQIEKVMSIEQVKQNYNPHVSDQVKEAIRAKGQEYLKENMLEYFKLWIRLGIRYTKLYIKAWIEQTKGYWNGGYSFWIVADSVYGNTFGISQIQQDNALSRLLLLWKDCFFGYRFFEPFRSIGFHVWMIVLAMVYSIMRRRKECIIPISLIIIVLSLLVATPVFSEFRYVYSLFAAFPFVMLITFANTDFSEKHRVDTE